MSTLKVDTITDELGTGAPDFPNGIALSGTPLSGVASEAEAEAGTDNAHVMTPLRVKQSVDANVGAATAGLAAGSVGTYAWVRESSALSGSLRFGATFAGSSLRTNGYYSATSLGTTVQYAGNSGGSLSGTWRIMGDSHHPSANVMNQTLALRIS